MTPPTFVLLPGLDGTGDLFGPFAAAAPSGYAMQAIRLPSEGPQTYAALVSRVQPMLPTLPMVLIAESFSGPLAVFLAERVSNVVAVVLCASFVAPPLPRFLTHFAGAFLRMPALTSALGYQLTGGDRTQAAAARVATESVARDVLVRRIDSVLHVDATEAFTRLAQPVLYLRATRDRVVSRRCAEVIRKLGPSTRVVDVEGPHLLLQTKPHEAWQQIQAFIEDSLLVRK